MKQQFYSHWKNKTNLEKSGIITLKLAKKLIFDNIPLEEIVSIYIKGSFVRREMTRKSDIDIVTVLRTKKYFGRIKRLDEWGKVCGLKPYPQFLGCSLWELKTGKKARKKIMENSSHRMVKHLGEYGLIYGMDLTERNFFMRSDKEDLKGMVNIFIKKWIPDYERGNFFFGMLIKQTFWLVENEQRAKGNNPPHSWKKLRDSIEDKNHIIYDAWMLRENPTKDKRTRKKYVSRLKRYLEVLK